MQMSVKTKSLDYSYPFCYILVGPPASGKTTLRRQLIKHPTLEDAFVISTDDLIEDKCNNTGRTYSEVFSTFNSEMMNVQMRKLAGAATKKSKNIIVDRCNLTKASRKNLLSLIPNYYNTVMVVLEYEEEEILRRAKQRSEETGKHIPYSTLCMMFSQFEYPEPDECDLIIHQKSSAI